MRLADALSKPWLTSKPFRTLVLFLGIVFVIVFGLMLILLVISASVSLIYLFVILGLTGGVACFRYFRRPKPILLVPMLAALILTMIYLASVLWSYLYPPGPFG